MGAEVVGLGADELEELSEDDSAEYFRLGAEDEEEFRDYAGLALKPDHANRCSLPLVPAHARAPAR